MLYMHVLYLRHSQYQIFINSLTIRIAWLLLLLCANININHVGVFLSCASVASVTLI